MWPFNRKNDRTVALNAIRNAPGPSPWFLVDSQIHSSTGTFSWKSAGDKEPWIGKSILTDSTGRIFAAADFYCYIKVVPNNRLLVWYAVEEGYISTIRLQLFNVDQFHPLSGPKEVLPQLNPACRFVTSTDPIGVLDLSTSREDGLHTVSVPEAFSELGEIFILVSSTGDKVNLRLWTLRTATGELEVTPQHWFNHGN